MRGLGWGGEVVMVGLGAGEGGGLLSEVDGDVHFH